MNNTNNEVIGWGDSFTAEENEFTLISPGNYPFTVKSMDRKIYDGSGKIPNGTPYAEVKCEVTGPEGTTSIIERLYLLKRMQWKLTQFFQSIGQPVVVGQPFQPNWNTVVGSQGIAEVEVNEYNDKNGNAQKNNRIKNFLKPGEGTQGPAEPVQQMSQQQAPQPQAQPQTPPANNGWNGGAAF
ncbi:hypothetical protein LFYK43_14110 [Ligilactobacillus salitolerans]|uniref:Phage protein n=1 Tax=Ligilactobacillus salitolerans TaxID=1808352 RepID=A0A401ITU2_9LACO|nr:hypothetical protein [Ligilactobacillus salitolerans]GBG94952.1 hypothetical protein LFYK43_14110 [Ligilactobacillus salitolerans]